MDTRRRHFERRVLAGFALVAVATVGVAYGVASLRNSIVHAAGRLAPQPIQYPGFPVPAARIQAWIAANNVEAMRQHAWDLWKGINAITPESQGYPVWETWYSGPEIGDQSKGTCAPSSLTELLSGPERSAGQPTHDFQIPEQFHHGPFARRRLAATSTAENTGAVTVLEEVTVKFDADYAQFVLNNHYCDATTLWKLQESWGTQPLVNRHIKEFPRTAIGLKPTYEFVNGPNHNNGITLVNYWKGDLTTGPENSTNYEFPTPDTWAQCVVVNTGSGGVPPGLHCAITNDSGTVSPSGVVGIDQFYHFPITAAQATAVCQQNQVPEGQCPLQAGDYAILVGMHMSTKEDKEWTWQTFWWNYGSTFPYGPPPAGIPAPFNHYAMAAGYSMTVQKHPNGPNTLAYNPYLETGLGPSVHGTNSTCMSCHTVASLGNNPNSNWPSGGNPPDSPNSGSGYPAFYSGQLYDYTVWNPTAQKAFYDCMTTTDTSWFVQGFAGSGPDNQPPCVLTSSVGKPAKH